MVINGNKMKWPGGSYLPLATRRSFIIATLADASRPSTTSQNTCLCHRMHLRPELEFDSPSSWRVFKTYLNGAVISAAYKLHKDSVLI